MEDKRLTTVMLTRDLKKEVKKLSTELDMSIQQFVKLALIEYIEKCKQGE